MEKGFFYLFSYGQNRDKIAVAQYGSIERDFLTCLAMAMAVFLLSPVSKTTRIPILFSVAMVACASFFTVSATAIIATRLPKTHTKTKDEKTHITAETTVLCTPGSNSFPGKTHPRWVQPKVFVLQLFS